MATARPTLPGRHSAPGQDTRCTRQPFAPFWRNGGQRIRAALAAATLVALMWGHNAHAQNRPTVDYKQLVGYIKAGQSTLLREALQGRTREDINFSGRAVLKASAACSRHPDIIDVLADWGIDFNRSMPTAQLGTADDAITPLMLALGCQVDKSVIERLIARGADVNRRIAGLTPLGVALSTRQFDVGHLLLDKGADTDVRDDVLAMTPLMELGRAAREGDGPVVRSLAERMIRAGADVNAASIDGTSVLSWCVTGGSTIVLRTLLSRGANPNVRDDAGESPFELARRTHRDDLATLLEHAGAPP